MATEYKLSYTASEINEKLGQIDELSTNAVSIESIEKTSTNGLVDTYTITLTDGSTTTFDVTNGKEITNISMGISTGEFYIPPKLIIEYNDSSSEEIELPDIFDKDITVEEIENGIVVRLYNGADLSSYTITNGQDGEDYVLTDTDKEEIASLVLGMIEDGDEVAY